MWYSKNVKFLPPHPPNALAFEDTQVADGGTRASDRYVKAQRQIRAERNYSLVQFTYNYSSKGLLHKKGYTINAYTKKCISRVPRERERAFHRHRINVHLKTHFARTIAYIKRSRWRRRNNKPNNRNGQIFRTPYIRMAPISKMICSCHLICIYIVSNSNQWYPKYLYAISTTGHSLGT